LNKPFWWRGASWVSWQLLHGAGHLPTSTREDTMAKVPFLAVCLHLGEKFE
jgi:hypothetical protein